MKEVYENKEEQKRQLGEKIFSKLPSPLTRNSLTVSGLTWGDIHNKTITWEQLANNLY